MTQSLKERKINTKEPNNLSARSSPENPRNLLPSRIRMNIMEKLKRTLRTSVAIANPGSGAFLAPQSGIRNMFFPNPGSRIPDPQPIFLKA
jgi:hypothetical protein